MNRSATAGLALALAVIGSPALAATILATPANVWTQTHDVAQPGDIVQLQTGTYDLSMWNLVKAAPGITITPAPGATVVANVIAVNGSQNVTYLKIPVQMLPTTQYGVDAEGSTTTNVTFDGLVIKGPSCTTLAGVGAWFRSLGAGSGVTIKNSTFSCLGSALGALDVDGLTVDRNAIDTVMTDAIIMTGATNIVVSNNTATNWDNALGGHPDFIQFAASQAGPSAHVKITGNFYMRGPGDPAQNIFIEDGSDFLIQGNASIGAAYYGLGIARTTDSTVCNNFVQPLLLSDDFGSYDLVRQSAARIQFIAEAVPVVAVGVSGEDQPTTITVNGTLVTSTPIQIPGTPAPVPAKPGDMTQYNTWAAKPNPCPTATSPPPPVVIPPPVVTPPPVVIPPAVDPLQPQLDAANKQIAADKVKIAAQAQTITTVTNQLQVQTAATVTAQAATKTAQAATAAAQASLTKANANIAAGVALANKLVPALTAK